MNWHEYFIYDAETGNLIWRERPLSHFTSAGIHAKVNRTMAGKVAGTVSMGGRANPKRVSVQTGGTSYGAHCIVWEMHNGPIPNGLQIDHINRNPLDNRIENLRLATNGQNKANSVPRNRLGMKGVVLTASGRYAAQITAHGKHRSLGTFNTAEEAHAAYSKAAIDSHGEYARTA